MSSPTLQVIVGSTRPGRVGLPVSRWFADVAGEHGAFDVEVLDLAEIDLPLMDEPHHPRLRRYEHGHTKAWSATVDRGDAYVFVTPEYNHSFGAPLKNAIDYLHNEWLHKPVGFVSYGGVSGGTRAVQALKPVVGALKMTALTDAVNIPFVHQQVEDGRFVPNEVTVKAATAMLDELERYAASLRDLRRQLAS
jgi:NAD(P)H-dependent FMN reductase